MRCRWRCARRRPMRRGGGAGWRRSVVTRENPAGDFPDDPSRQKDNDAGKIQIPEQFKQQFKIVPHTLNDSTACPMSEKLKLAIRLSADTKEAVRAFADLKHKSRDTRQALEQARQALRILAARIRFSRMRGQPSARGRARRAARGFPADRLCPAPSALPGLRGNAPRPVRSAPAIRNPPDPAPGLQD